MNKEECLIASQLNGQRFHIRHFWYYSVICSVTANLFKVVVLTN